METSYAYFKQAKTVATHRGVSLPDEVAVLPNIVGDRERLAVRVPRVLLGGPSTSPLRGTVKSSRSTSVVLLLLPLSVLLWPILQAQAQPPAVGSKTCQFSLETRFPRLFVIVPCRWYKLVP